METPHTFRTPRLLLRPTEAADADFLHRLMNTADWHRYIGDRQIDSPAAAERYIAERITPQFARLGYGNYTIVRQSDGVRLGTCGLYSRQELADIDLGFALLPEHYRRGYAYEAARELQRAAFAEFGLPRLCAITVPENAASRALLEKLGFRPAGTVRLAGDTALLLRYRYPAEFVGSG